LKFIDANDTDYSPAKFLTFDDVQLVPRYSSIPSRNDPSISLACQFTSQTKMNMPIVSANMDTVTEGTMAETMFHYGGYGILHRFYESKYGQEGFEKFVNDIKKMKNRGVKPAFSVGASPNDIQVVQKVLDLIGGAGAIVTVDMANGNTKLASDAVRRLRDIFKDKIEIIGGNVCTQEGVALIVMAGADAVKVGTGSGRVCSTRVVTGVGVPQLTAIMHARKAINRIKSNASVIADGGIRSSGDIVKALAAGANCVMIGGLLAGTTETPTALVDGQRLYRGMSSATVNAERNKRVSAEGVQQLLSDKGSVTPILEELVGGIRSAMTYCDARNLVELCRNAVFIEVSHASQVEATPHALRGDNNV
jgi:IMP dehydrogenase